MARKPRLSPTRVNSSDLSGLLLSPLVIAARLPMLWSEAMNPTVNGQIETKRMISEKLAATQEGIVGAQMALGQAMMENFAAMMFGQMPKATPQGTADAMLQASLAPAARKVRANIKRLSRS